MSTAETDEAEILAQYQGQLDAMGRGDTAALDELLDDRFTLTHITGYRQRKTEWLSEMRAGQFRYHRIDQRSATVALAGDTATLVGRFVVDATVYGSRSRWRLQLAQTYTRLADHWTTTASVATTW
jgi:hypothetical protein